MKKIEFDDNAPKVRSTFVLPQPLDHALEIYAATEQRLKSEVVIDAIRSFINQQSRTLPQTLSQRSHRRMSENR